MKTLKTVSIFAAITLFSTALLFSQKKNSAVSEVSSKKDTIKTTVNGQEINLTNFATEENFEMLFNENKAIIVHYGFAPVYNADFEKKYGVKIYNAGCVVLPGNNNPATINNQLISKLLTKNFGENWKKDLGFQPFGTE